MNKKVLVRIQGTSPLLMNRFNAISPDDFKKMVAEEQVKWAEYRDPETEELYVPGIAIQRCLVNAAVYSKGKGRASLQKQVAACVLITPEMCSLGVKNYEIDSRAVVVPATKGRILRHRPRFDMWSTEFVIEYDTALLSENELRKIVDDAGSRVGLLDFRPEKKGPFGRFMVTSWEN